MLAAQQHPEAKMKDMTKWLKERYAYTDSTLYGYGTRGSIFDTAMSLGYIDKHGKSYSLTEKGKKVVDSSTMLKDAVNGGSDLHRQILAKTIEKLHESNMLVIAPRDREAHDLIAYPVDRHKKYLWDDEGVRAYEIQTSARKDAVSLNGEKSTKYNMPITWVTPDKGILDNIKELTGNKDSYMLVSLDDGHGR